MVALMSGANVLVQQLSDGFAGCITCVTLPVRSLPSHPYSPLIVFRAIFCTI